MYRLTALALIALTSAISTATDAHWNSVATFSILGFDPATGEIGGAVQSRVFSVGNGVLWAEAGVGAVATQAIVDVSYGPQCLELLKKGMPPEDIIKRVWEKDPDPRAQNWSKQGRQFAVIDSRGQAAAFTGPKASPWAGHRYGKFCTAQGNILAGEGVVNGMVKAFEDTRRAAGSAAAGRARSGADRRRRQARNAIGGSADCKEGRRRRGSTMTWSCDSRWTTVRSRSGSFAGWSRRRSSSGVVRASNHRTNTTRTRRHEEESCGVQRR